MEFGIKLELLCIQMCNELGFKLIRVHTPKLCLINLVTWMMVVRLRELCRHVPVGQPLRKLCRGASAVR